MKNLKYPAYVFLVILLGACATVVPPKLKPIPNEVPQVSKTIAEKLERSLKRRVAIARFSNETKYGQGFFFDKNDDRLGKQAMDILSSKLAATDKFILLERSDLSKIIDEQKIANLDTMKISAEYLILGSVTEFGRKATSDVGLFSRTKKQTAYAKVMVRLIEVKTGRIVYTESGEGEAEAESGTVLGMGKTASYDATLNDKVIGAAISKLVNNIVENLLDSPWRSFILSYEDSNYVISGGELQGIITGDVFTVYKRGKKVFNPQTNVNIELPGKPVGTLMVVSTIPGDAVTELSVCIKTTGEVPTSGFEEYYIQEK